ncbi:AI-2E family transporter [Clostridium sp. B9]|uniref:AI-2E family transporter n=1 Tax=Clostridium sp. B9 TaxID=3423224 RepID=UPI003D2ECB4B
MNNFFKNNLLYFKIILVVIVSYISIKLIDNMSDVMSALDTMLTILSPFILAFIIAYILNPIVNLFNKRFKLSRGLSIVVTYLLFVISISLALTYLFPKLYTSLVELIDNIPEFTVYVQNLFTEIMAKFKIPEGMNAYLPHSDSSKFIASMGLMISSLSNWLLETAISLTSSLINWVFGFLISIYVLIDKDKFLYVGGKITRVVFGKKIGDSLIRFVKILNEKIGTYVGIKAIDSLIIGILAFIGLTIMKSDYTLLLSVVVGITNMIPYFGPFIGMVVGFFINVFVSPLKALFVLIYLFLLQQFDAWYLDPKLIGNRVGLSPFLVILGVTIGGAVYGPIGMILGSPVMSVFKIYLKKLINKFEYRAE